MGFVDIREISRIVFTEGYEKRLETNARIRNGSTATQKDRCRVLGTLILHQYTEFRRERCMWMRIVIICVKPVDEKYAVKCILTNKNDTPSSGTRSNSFMCKANFASIRGSFMK